MKIIKSILLLSVILVTIASFQNQPVTLFMIGDSTMANKNISGEMADNQERGWGQMLQQFFDSTKVVVDNHAVNGRSSKSFIDEGRWDVVLQRMKQGDYLIIQFGHNDEKTKIDRHTEPGTTFDANLKRFIKEARDKGVTPILMNSIVRRKFAADTLIDTHGEYVVAPRKVAKETRCLFVDATKLTHDYIQPMGSEDSKKLFCWLPEGKYKSAPKGRQDDTHLNIYGATEIASLLIQDVARQDKTLSKALLMAGSNNPK